MKRLIRIILLIVLIYFGYNYCKDNNINFDKIKETFNNTKEKIIKVKEKSDIIIDAAQKLKDVDKEKENKSIAKLTIVGDLLFEQPFYDAVSNGYDKNTYFSKVKDYFEDDDLSIANMEVVIGNDNMKTSGVGYNFCAPPWVGDLVSYLSFEVLGTANNHAFDRGVEGINSTLDYFSNTSIKTIGTRKNSNDSFLLYLEKNEIKFGITAYTYGTNQKPSNNNRNLINYYKDQNGNIRKEEIKKDINELKKNSDVVIVIMHWGLEFRYEPNSEQKELAKYLNELGVDIIVGSHSHNISPMEVIGDEHKTLVYYSLGNFVSHDDDIARTPAGEEEFDNAYQVGLLSKLNVIKEDNNIKIDDVKTELIVNYFDKNMNNFVLVPFKEYNEEYEKNHFRYNKGLTKEFINNMYNKVIAKEYR